MGRLGHTLSTLRPVGRPTGRKTRFRLLARLYRVGSLAHWVPPKGFFDASYIAFLLSQAFPGASALRSATPLSASQVRQSAPDRVASGRYRPEAPTDPYVLALEHTVPQLTGSLHVCKPNVRCARQPAGSAGAGDGNGPSSSTACGCGGRATSASGAEPPRGTWRGPPSCPSHRSTRSDRVAFRSASAAAR